jgi:hypothetical protein
MRPRIAEAVIEKATRILNKKPDPDRAILEELMRSRPTFDALVEHFKSAYDLALVENEKAVKTANNPYISYTSALIQSNDGHLRWLTKYASKEQKNAR